MAQCPRDGTPLLKAAPGTSLGADALSCPKCSGTSTSSLGVSWFLSQLGLKGTWAELIQAQAVTLTPEPSQVKCPRWAAGECRLIDIHGVELDACGNCGGAWFDGGEAQRLKHDEPACLEQRQRLRRQHLRDVLGLPVLRHESAAGQDEPLLPQLRRR